MYKRILFPFLLFTSFNSMESDVYICGPKGAKKYHFSKTCRGLGNCNDVIKQVTIKEAESFGLTLCGWEDW